MSWHLQERLKNVFISDTSNSAKQSCFDVTMREAMAGSPDGTLGESTNTAKKFDSHGLPLVPQPSGANSANGHHNGHQIPVEP
jgi:hypothetical protein